jgi:hypothetical protein
MVFYRLHFMILGALLLFLLLVIGGRELVVFYRLLFTALGALLLFLLFRRALEDARVWIREGISRRSWPDLEILEPQVIPERVGNRLRIRFLLPDVESEKDVHLRRFQTSVEVKARGKDRVYFKIYPLQKGARILSRRLEGGEYTLEVEL